MPEGRDVTLLLQFEAILVDAARGIDRKHELQVDGGLGGRRRCHRKREQQRAGQGAPSDSGRKDAHAIVCSSSADIGAPS
jgi:hypothetical protein